MKNLQIKIQNRFFNTANLVQSFVDAISNVCAKCDRVKHRFIYSSILYFFILCIAFNFFIVKQYGSYGSYYAGFSAVNLIVSMLCIVLISYFLPKMNQYTSSIFIHVQFLIMYMPMFVLSSFENESIVPMIGITSILMLQIFLTKYFLNKSVNDRVQSENLKHMNILVYILIGISFVVIIYSIFAVRMPSLKAFNLNTVYELRGTNHLSSITIYLANWTSIAINPFLIIYLFDRKDYKKGILVLIFQIIMYMIFVYKSYLFSLLIIVFFYWWSKKGHILISLHLGIISLVIGALLAYATQLNILLMIPALIINRLLFIPAKIKFCYFDFFSNHNYLYFSEGIIGKIFNMEAPYPPKGISYHITDVYFPHSPGSNANTGYVSDAFANMGWIGVFLIGFIIIGLFICIDKYNTKINRYVIIGVFSYVFILYNDAAFLTSLLTGGVGILLFMVVFLNLPLERLKLQIAKGNKDE